MDYNLSFLDYQRKVVEIYHQKRETGELSSRLIQLTTANLKRECEFVCEERFDKRDERVLRDFFGASADKDGYLEKIRNHDVDKFRALLNFLKKKSDGTSHVNIKLLAWLINFQRYDDWLRNRGVDDNNSEKTSVQDDFSNDSIQTFPEKAQSEKNNQKKWIWILLFTFLLFVSIAYLLGISRNKNPNIDHATSCMYWTGDHYEPISCVLRNDTLVVPLDSNRLLHFRRVLRPDTIREEHVGRLWYRKKNNKLELFTAGGFHPIETTLRLRLLSLSMYQKYLAKPDSIQ